MGDGAMAPEKSTRIITSSGFPQYTADFEWKFYKSLVENYFALNAVADIDQQKELFISYLPAELLDLVFALIGLENLPQTTMADIFDQLTAYFDTEMSVFSHRRKFYRRDQEEQESISDFAKALKVLAESCNFGNEANSHLCNCFVMGLNQEKLQKMLMGCKGQTFEALVKRATALECAVARDVKGGGDQNQNEMSDCVFNDLGCNYKGSVKQMEHHMVQFSSKHVLLCKGALHQKMKEQNEMIKQQIDAMQLQINAQNNEIRGQKQTIDLLQDETAFLKKPEFVWCISGMAEHIKKSEEDIDYCIASNTFYTNSGYKLSAKLYPNDYDTDSVCVFVCLHPGIYDSILKWPFDEAVTFTVHDQEADEASSYSGSFVADPNNWDGCQSRPHVQTESHGIYDFLPLADLKKFINDDKLVITIAAKEPEY